MSWFVLKTCLERGDVEGLVQELAAISEPLLEQSQIMAERQAEWALELALRDLGHGPVLAVRDGVGAFGLHPVWHWCINHRTAFGHSQASCDEHRACSIITVPVYESKENTAPRGAKLHLAQGWAD